MTDEWGSESGHCLRHDDAWEADDYVYFYDVVLNGHPEPHCRLHESMWKHGCLAAPQEEPDQVGWGVLSPQHAP